MRLKGVSLNIYLRPGVNLQEPTQHTTMIHAPMRNDDGINFRKVNIRLPGVIKERVVRPHVEQELMFPSFYVQRQPMP